MPFNNVVSSFSLSFGGAEKGKLCTLLPYYYRALCCWQRARRLGTHRVEIGGCGRRVPCFVIVVLRSCAELKH
jgi:hypothetical protein